MRPWVQAASSTAEYEALSNLLQQAWTQAPHALVTPCIYKHALGSHACASVAGSYFLMIRHRY